MATNTPPGMMGGSTNARPASPGKLRRQVSSSSNRGTRQALVGVMNRSALEKLQGQHGGDEQIHSELLSAMGEPAPSSTLPAEPGWQRHVLAIVLICGLIAGGMVIGLAIDTSGGANAKLGAVSVEVCQLPLEVRPFEAPICARCTCCSNAATSLRTQLHCPACVTCCAHCPRCSQLSEEHADCLQSGGKVEAFKGFGRGWFCVPASYPSGSGLMPEWFSSVLDFNPEWKQCAADEMPDCDDLRCTPDAATQHSADAATQHSADAPGGAPPESAARGRAPRAKPTPSPRPVARAQLEPAAIVAEPPAAAPAQRGEAHAVDRALPGPAAGMRASRAPHRPAV